MLELDLAHSAPLSFRFVKSYRELNGLDGNFVRHLVQVNNITRESIMRGYLTNNEKIT